MNIIRLVLFFAVASSFFAPCGVASGGIFTRTSHAALVVRSGIRPHNIGSAEGVGMSSRGYIEARNNACFWGRKQALSVQYSKRGGMFYAVVRYR